MAPLEALRAAGADYPDWVLERYLGLPDDFPQRVSQLALDLTLGQPTRYDETVAIESYLRGIEYDLTVPDAPVGARPVHAPCQGV